LPQETVDEICGALVECAELSLLSPDAPVPSEAFSCCFYSAILAPRRVIPRLVAAAVTSLETSEGPYSLTTSIKVIDAILKPLADLMRTDPSAVATLPSLEDILTLVLKGLLPP
jgi:hypothetical protein